MEFTLNFLRGYICVEVTGFSIHRFLNLCANKKVFLWDIQYRNSKMYCCTYIKNFYVMGKLCKKTGCKIKIAKKVGLPFISFRYRKRKILAFGSFVFIGIIYFLSTFIWYIDISGSDTINNYEILQVLEYNGVKVGKLKKRVVAEQLEKEIQKNFPTITWVSVYKEGTTLVVKMSESIKNNFVIEEDVPTHIIAKKEGVVVYTKTSKGKQEVVIGDVVKKGDILVSGEIFLNEDEKGKHYTYVRAISEIRGETTYNFDFNIDKKLIIKTKTGKSKTNHKISIFGKTYDFFNYKIKYENYDKNTYRTQLKLSDKYRLPIVIIKEEYLENEVSERFKTDEEIEKESEQILNNLINSKLNIDVDILNKEINVKKTSQNIEVYSIIYVIENIGAEETFTPTLENTKENDENLNEEVE